MSATGTLGLPPAAARQPSLRRGRVLALRFVAHVLALDSARQHAIARACVDDDAATYQEAVVATRDAAARAAEQSLGDPQRADLGAFLAALDALVDAGPLDTALGDMVKTAARGVLVHADPATHGAFAVVYAPFQPAVPFTALLLG